MSLGDFVAGATVHAYFRTTDLPGNGLTLSGSPVVSVYKNGSLTQSVAGVTLDVDFDGVTGSNHVAVDLSADVFYAAANDFAIQITTGTVNGISVAGETVDTFSIVNRSGALEASLQALITTVGAAGAGLTATALTAAEHTAIAEVLLKLDLSTITGESARSVINALRFLRNKWSISGGTLTVTKEDDSTTAWTATVSTDPSADPIIGSDPA